MIITPALYLICRQLVLQQITCYVCIYGRPTYDNKEHVRTSNTCMLIAPAHNCLITHVKYHKLKFVRVCTYMRDIEIYDNNVMCHTFWSAEV